MSDIMKKVFDADSMKAFTSLGLAGVIGYLAFSHLLATDKAGDDFLRTTFLEAMTKNTQANTENSRAMGDLAQSVARIAEEMDDISDQSREVVSRFDRLSAQWWDEQTMHMRDAADRLTPPDP